jgi:hypothetical protein
MVVAFQAYQRLLDRFDDVILRTQSHHPDCVRIWKRLSLVR